MSRETRRRAPWTSILLAACLVPLLMGKGGAAEAQAGQGKFVLPVRGKEIEVHTYRPAGYKGGPLIVVMHGLNRNAADYRDNAQVLGDRFGALIVAPRFGLKEFPVADYQQGGILREGAARPSDEWTFRYISDVVQEMRRRENRPALPYYLIGHSAGGQFLTRLAAFMPGEAVRIVACNPGSLLFPTPEMPFHYGYGGLPPALSDEPMMKAYLAAPLTLFLGTADTLSANLDRSELAMQQGATRLERGRACYKMAQELARAKGWPFNWRMVEAPDVGHDNKAMFAHPKVHDALFGP